MLVLSSRKTRCFPTPGTCLHGSLRQHALLVGLLRAFPVLWTRSPVHKEGPSGLDEPSGPPQTSLPLCSYPSRVPVVTEEVAREALLSFVNSKCCYGSTAADNLVIQELKQQTLCRVRGQAWRAGVVM